MYSEPCARLTKSMMPNTSVKPAASRNSSSPNCSPFRNCSTISSISPTTAPQENSGSARAPPLLNESPRSLHLAFVVEAILVVLDNSGNGFQRKLAIGVLHHVLQIEVLDRDMVLAVFERAAHRLEIRLLHLGAHCVLLGGVAVHRRHGAVDQLRGIIGLRAVKARTQVGVLLAVVGHELLVLFVRQIVDPLLRAGNAERVLLLQRQRQLVDGKGGVERNLLLDAGLGILIEELHAGGTRIEHED